MSPFLIHGIEWVITAILAGAVGWFGNSLRKKQTHDDAMEQGMRVLLRTQIVDGYYKYHVQQKKMTVERRAELDETFDAYTKLGGNGTVAQLFHELDDDDVWILDDVKKEIDKEKHSR